MMEETFSPSGEIVPCGSEDCQRLADHRWPMADSHPRSAGRHRLESHGAAVCARVAAAPQHTVRLAADDLPAPEKRPRVPGHVRLQRMPPFRKLCQGRAWDAAFQMHLSPSTRRVNAKPGAVERGLWVEAVVNHPDD